MLQTEFMHKKLTRAALIAAAILLLPARAVLAQTTYDYTGNDFTGVDGPFTTSDSVSGSFTVAQALGDNLSFVIIDPTSFSFTDGVDTITNANSNAFDDGFEVATNASGEITNWSIDVEGSGPGLFSILLGNTNGAAQDGGVDGGSVGFNIDDPGTWSTAGTGAPVAVTPEPSTLALLGTGVLGLAGAVRRRFLAA
jgi:hypothetical protein